jgi:hypothetical protein
MVKMTSKNTIIVWLAFLPAFSVWGGVALGEPSGTMSMALPRFSVGFSPLMALLSTFAKSMDISGEALITPQWYLTVDASYLAMNLTSVSNGGKTKTSSNASAASEPTTNKLSEMSLRLGTRWYLNPTTDCWYTAAAVGMNKSTSTRPEARRSLSGSTTAMVYDVSSGYRSVFRHGGFILVGVGANYRNVISDTVGANDGQPLGAEEKNHWQQQQQQPAVSPKLAFTIGYLFR